MTTVSLRYWCDEDRTDERTGKIEIPDALMSRPGVIRWRGRFFVLHGGEDQYFETTIWVTSGGYLKKGSS